MSLRSIAISIFTIGLICRLTTMTTANSDNYFIEVQKPAQSITEVAETKLEETLTAEEVSEGQVETAEVMEEQLETTAVEENVVKWGGPILNSRNGVVNGPSGKETYYNLNMSGVIRIMESLGYNYEYYVREDGVKMYGPYVMCAANLNLRPRGSILETSLGTAIVCDTGGFANNNPTQVDIAVNW